MTDTTYLNSISADYSIMDGLIYLYKGASFTPPARAECGIIFKEVVE